MNKNKSIFVTALCAILLASLLVSLYMLNHKASLILAGVLALYGFTCGAFHFCHWLEKESALPPVQPEWEPDEEFVTTYDQIKAELEEEDARTNDG